MVEHAEVFGTGEACSCTRTRAMVCVSTISRFVSHRSVAVRAFYEVQSILDRCITDDQLS